MIVSFFKSEILPHLYISNNYRYFPQNIFTSFSTKLLKYASLIIILTLHLIGDQPVTCFYYHKMEEIVTKSYRNVYTFLLCFQSCTCLLYFLYFNSLFVCYFSALFCSQLQHMVKSHTQAIEKYIGEQLETVEKYRTCFVSFLIRIVRKLFEIEFTMYILLY